MKFTIIDTHAAYRHIVASDDKAAQEAIFRDELIAPFAEMAARFGSNDPIAAFAQWGIRLEQLLGEQQDQVVAKLDALAEANAFGRGAQAIKRAWQAFAPYAERIPMLQVTFGVYLADLSAVPLSEGFSGNGAIPGYVMTLYDRTDAYSLARVEPVTAHEFNHNVRFAVVPFHMMTTSVGDYIVAEGLAEAFAVELYGNDLLGPWVTGVQGEQLEQARSVIGGALDTRGFNIIRSYIFGDAIAEGSGLPKVGVPPFGGYAVGYQVVQAFVANSGISAAEATFLSAEEIIAGSGYFS
jgi:uncharacterized protein YjaZ